jgi:hypothetical protein
MKTLEAYLAERRELTIHTVAGYARDYIRERWQPVLEESHAEFEEAFARAGDYGYAVFARKLFGSLREQLIEAGFGLDPDFPGTLDRSMEQWGPPEWRERCMWCVLRKGDGPPLGSLVTRMFHDHTRFRIPAAPAVFALEESEDAAIRRSVSDASTRMREGDVVGVQAAGPAETPWEYAVEIGLGDAFDSSRSEFVEGMLDRPLKAWALHGWELTSVVSHEGRLLAFFKRPGRS